MSGRGGAGRTLRSSTRLSNVRPQRSPALALRPKARTRMPVEWRAVVARDRLKRDIVLQAKEKRGRLQVVIRMPQPRNFPDH